MKRLLLKIVVVTTLIMSALNSCSKDESLQDPGGVTSRMPTILILTTNHWEAESNEIFVNTFKNVIPQDANYSVKVYLQANGEEMQLDHPVRFETVALWATSTQTDVKIYYRGRPQDILYLNIKVVLE